MPGMYEPLVNEMTGAFKLPPAFCVALVQVESGFDPDAWNPEPRYRWLINVRTGQPFRKLTEQELASKFPPKDFPAPPGVDPDAEFWGQQASWGLGQLMGANARALGFKGKFMTRLSTDPAEGLRLAFLHLSRIRDQFLKTVGWQGVAAAYNAGSPRREPDGSWGNQQYVDKIEAAMGGAWPK